MIINQSVKIKDQKQAKSSKMEVKYRAFYLSIDIIKFLGSLDKKGYIRIISDQLIRCATSVGANIVEAKASSSKREFLNYFQIALKSAKKRTNINPAPFFHGVFNSAEKGILVTHAASCGVLKGAG